MSDIFDSTAVRSLSLREWPEPDRLAWERACQPGARLKRGGAAGRLRRITQDDLARRYGYFFDHLARMDKPLSEGRPADQVIPENIDSFLAELKARVKSVTVYGTIYKVRRTAELIAPDRDLEWLKEIERELDFQKRPSSKFDKLVTTPELIEAGLTLLHEAEIAQRISPYRCVTERSREARRRAKGKADRYQLNRGVLARNGLMLGILALCPIRLTNLAALSLGTSLAKVGDTWWIVIEPDEAKSGRPDERPIPAMLTMGLNRYVEHHRLVLARHRFDNENGPLWISSETGAPMSYGGVESCIRRITGTTLGVEIGAHAARPAAATTAASRAPHFPALASALLQHTDPRVTEQHYNRATAHTAAQAYADVLRGIEKA